jgi:hypothetical protein
MIVNIIGKNFIPGSDQIPEIGRYLNRFNKTKCQIPAKDRRIFPAYCRNGIVKKIPARCPGREKKIHIKYG